MASSLTIILLIANRRRVNASGGAVADPAFRHSFERLINACAIVPL